MTPRKIKKERQARGERERPAQAAGPAPGARTGDEARRWAAIVFFVALGVRLLNGLFLLNRSNPFFDPTQLGTSVDMWENHMQATEIVKNWGFPNGVFLHSPLYPQLVALFYLFDQGNYYFVYWTQLILGALACAMLYACGRHFFEERIARLGALAAACYGPLIFNDLIFQSDSVAPMAVVGLLILAINIQQKPDRPLRRAAWAGLGLGLLVGLRPPLALLGPALACWILWVMRDRPLKARLSAIAVIAAVSLLIILPYCVHNTRVSGKLTLTQGQMELTRGLCFGAESTGYFNYPEGPNPPLLHFPSLAFFKLQLRKIMYLGSWFEFPDLYNYYVIGRISPLIRYNPLTFRVIGPLAFLGLLLGLRRFRSLSLLYLTLAVQAISIVLFYVSSRFRAPMMPILLLFAAQACFVIYDGFRKKETGKALAFLAGVALLAVPVNMLDTSRLHSMWYSDTLAGNGFIGQVVDAYRLGDYALAARKAERILWIRYPQYQLAGSAILNETHGKAGHLEEARKYGEIAERLQSALVNQPIVDYHGNTYFPPSDRFGTYEPFKEIAAPKDLLGYTASVYPPRPGAKKVNPIGMPRVN